MSVKSMLVSELDYRIISSTKSSYIFKTYFDDANITILSEDGVVTLEGHVKNEFQKMLADGVLSHLPGVKGINNLLTVGQPGPVEYSDAWIVLKLKAVLLFQDDATAFKTIIDVKDGVVTLTGEASTLAKKQLIGEYACDIAGVKDVINQMKVSDTSHTGESMVAVALNDAAITAQIEVALMAHPSTSALLTTVRTHAGTVTLSGKVGTKTEKELIAKLAHDVKGVKKVINSISVMQ